MTSLLDPPTDTHPVLVGMAEIEATLDQMLTTDVTPLAGGHAAAVSRLERIGRRIEALKLKVVAAANNTGAAADAGFTDTGAWVARTTTTTRSTAARQVALATELASGHDTTAHALDQGLVSPAHAAVIVGAGRDLPSGVSAEQRRQVEEHLVEQAQRFAPDQLRRLARRAIESIEPDQSVFDAHEDQLLRTEEEAARDKTRLSFHDNGDGTITGHFTVPTLAGAILQKVIQTITAPRRMRRIRGFETLAGARSSTTDQKTDRFSDWDHRRGLAFAEILEHLPTDHLHPKSAATLVVTIDHTILQGALKAAGLDTGHAITAAEARRLACNAGLIPAILGTRSVALDIGRESRLFSPAQRIAKGLEHDTCAADGCERPYAWCELHHRQPWSLGGRTDLADAVPLCHRHHRWIHDTGFNHRLMPDGSVRFSRRT